MPVLDCSSLMYSHVSSLHTLLSDAQKLSDPTWDSDFYDEIAPYVSVGFINCMPPC